MTGSPMTDTGPTAGRGAHPDVTAGSDTESTSAPAADGDATGDQQSAAPGRSRVRSALGALVSLLAFALVWFALVTPDRPGQLTAAAMLRIPVEALVLLALALLLPRRFGRILVAVAGVLLGVLAVVKVLDLGFRSALDRPFDPLSDWSYLGPATGVLRDAVGDGATTAVEVAAVVVGVGLLVLVPLSVVRLTRLAGRHRVGTTRAASAAAVVWVLCLLLGVQLVPGVPVASGSAAGLAYDHAAAVTDRLADQQSFAAAQAHDPAAAVPADRLLTALSGKDVLVTFVESYGRVALESPVSSPPVVAALDAGAAELRSAGFAARTAYLTSPTFGGISWLAHSTLQSGLWVDNQQRYDELLSTDRFTLSQAFARAGWRTVGVVPSNENDWGQGTAFYGYDQVYDARNVGYRGPQFGYSTMPDQFALATLQRRELAGNDRKPVMAEVDLASSHSPWAPLPSMVGWDRVGDGSVFDPMPANGRSAKEVWRDSRQVQAEYGRSIAYSVSAVLSFVRTYGDDDLVVIMLGDHQPATVVSGQGAGHDVPVTVVASDPAVLDRISGWGWQDGVRPGPGAPVWPMDAFRDRFLDAFGG